MAGRRKPREGLPSKPLKRAIEGRTRHIAGLMASGQWGGLVTIDRLSEEWGCAPSYVERLALHASILCRAVYSDPEFVADIKFRCATTFEFLAADLIAKVQERDKKGRPKLLGKRGGIPYFALPHYYEQARKLLASMLELVGSPAPTSGSTSSKFEVHLSYPERPGAKPDDPT